MKTRDLLLVLAMALVPAAASAQRNFGGLTYNFSFPAVDLERYVGENSWYGATLDLRRQMPSHPNITYGLSSGWYVFYNNVNELIEVPHGAISGEQYRNFNIIPILAGTQYSLGAEGGTRPYVGFNLGAYYARQELDIGLYAITETNWHFGVAPEAGVVFPAGHDGEFYFNARYHYLWEAGGYLGDQALTLAFFTLGIGFAWEY
jgi:hypothetical protein